MDGVWCSGWGDRGIGRGVEWRGATQPLPPLCGGVRQCDVLLRISGAVFTKPHPHSRRFPAADLRSWPVCRSLRDNGDIKSILSADQSPADREPCISASSSDGALGAWGRRRAADSSGTRLGSIRQRPRHSRPVFLRAVRPRAKALLHLPPRSGSGRPPPPGVALLSTHSGAWWAVRQVTLPPCGICRPTTRNSA